jgi:hypothetical protein
MKIELTGLETVRELTEEMRLCRVALESIARSLMAATEIPAAPPFPDKPLGADAVRSYATALIDMESEDADMIRERLREAGLTDQAIEAQILQFLGANTDEEETT